MVWVQRPEMASGPLATVADFPATIADTLLLGWRCGTDRPVTIVPLLLAVELSLLLAVAVELSLLLAVAVELSFLLAVDLSLLLTVAVELALLNQLPYRFIDRSGFCNLDKEKVVAR
ncbi:hypothetical protein Ahy_A02g005454 isoform B [Arachis hypogaea]|uniref:Uncharacterized protein n=1 Tax=Arachis hypogaea TaxID=3818 RepID=A0A445E6N4_ARAHY|nr:hypothetical protein Ahy_A02g005454 isoform B [Arachis hypogaea]